MSQQTDIATAITWAARTISDQPSLDQTLQAIVDAARNSVPGFDQVGISTVDRRGVIETRAITGDLVLELDEIQYGLGEGPCFDTLRRPDVHAITAPAIRHDQRWPRYVPAAVAAGLRSQMAVKLYVSKKGTLGGLNFYSTTSDEIDLDALSGADLFAAHAAIALDHAKERDELLAGLHSRKVIGQALGILMERYGMNEDRAFAFLVRASSSSNTKVRDIAQQLVDERNGH